MDDQAIIELFWHRSENAISETAAKYGNYCYCIAYNVLSNHEDSEECVNDTYYKVWESIPPTRPGVFSAFLVLPVPNHHNIRTFIGNVYQYFTNRRTFYWRGWCMRYGEKK